HHDPLSAPPANSKIPAVDVAAMTPNSRLAALTLRSTLLVSTLSSAIGSFVSTNPSPIEDQCWPDMSSIMHTEYSFSKRKS
ncbi:MAG TPA: hypothetical protein VGZ22_30920, partial [Isosphaeraceae bacterium]|nr:hypothetical protein [Isosphaeraceae bacterium]